MATTTNTNRGSTTFSKDKLNLRFSSHLGSVFIVPGCGLKEKVPRGREGSFFFNFQRLICVNDNVVWLSDPQPHQWGLELK
jgi:hypothetical protein